METNNTATKKPLNKKFIVALGAIVLFGGGYGIYKYVHSLAHESTDDAQIETKITPIVSKIPGYIKINLLRNNNMNKL